MSAPAPLEPHDNPYLPGSVPGSAAKRESTPSNVRWMIVILLMGFAFIGHFNRVSISVAGGEVLTKSGGLTEKQMGWVYSAFLIVYTAGMLPGGWVIDRFGPRMALTVMGLGMGFCVTLTGALGWTGLSYAALWLPLMAVRGTAGGFSVPLHPGAARSVSLWVPLPGRSTANGLVTAGALIGIAVTFPGFGWLMDRVQWPMAFVISGTTMMAFAVLWYFLSSDDAICHHWTNTAEKNLVQRTGTGLPRTPVTLVDFFGLFLNRGLVLLAVSYAAYSYFQYLFFYWIGHYFEKVLSLPVTESRRATFIVLMAMAFGMAAGGYCTDHLCRLFGRKLGCRGMAILGMSLSAACAWLGMAAKDPNQVIVYFSLALGALGVCEGIFWTTAPILAPRSGGMAGAFLNTVGNAGGLLAPIYTPMIGEHYGWPAAIAVACVICGFGALLWLIIPTDAPSQSDAQSQLS